MKYVLDTHTHTLASGHAYNTIREMAMAASEKNLELLCITEHAPAMPGTCHEFYFHNLKVVPRNQYGMRLLLGTEANILDYNGTLDLDEEVLRKMDIVIASLHTPCIKAGTVEQHTEAVINAIKNPYVNIIGHPDDARLQLNYEPIVKAAKEYGVLLELNNSSMNPNGFRLNARENAIKYLTLCKKYGVMISLGSDAHYADDILNYEYLKPILAEVEFPEELIVNTSVEKFLSFVK